MIKVKEKKIEYTFLDKIKMATPLYFTFLLFKKNKITKKDLQISKYNFTINKIYITCALLSTLALLIGEIELGTINPLNWENAYKQNKIEEKNNIRKKYRNEADSIFNKMNLNINSDLNLDEYLFYEIKNYHIEKFKKMDVDSNGTLSKKEFINDYIDFQMKYDWRY